LRHFLDRHLPDVGWSESCKVFGWCEPVQVLMGSGVVVENPEFIECTLQCPATWDDQLSEQWLERAEQTLDPAVLPGAKRQPDTRDLCLKSSIAYCIFYAASSKTRF
jgi:hypothetical protein